MPQAAQYPLGTPSPAPAGPAARAPCNTPHTSCKPHRATCSPHALQRSAASLGAAHHFHASALIGSPTEPSTRRDDRSYRVTQLASDFIRSRSAVGAVYSCVSFNRSTISQYLPASPGADVAHGILWVLTRGAPGVPARVRIVREGLEDHGGRAIAERPVHDVRVPCDQSSRMSWCDYQWYWHLRLVILVLRLVALALRLVILALRLVVLVLRLVALVLRLGLLVLRLPAPICD